MNKYNKIINILFVLLLLFSFVIPAHAANFSNKIFSEGTGYSLINDPVYSPNGKSYAYIATKNGKQFLVKDGEQSSEYGLVSNLIFSPDSKSYMFIAQKNGKYIIVKDGVESKAYGFVSDLRYSYDSKNVFFIGRNTNYTKYYFVINFVDSVEYNGASDIYSIGSPDVKSVVYVIKSKGKQTVVKDGVILGEYDKINNVQYSPDSKNLAFIAEKDGKSFIIKEDGTRSDGYDSIENNLQFSPNSRSFAFVAKKNGKWIVVKDGAENEYKLLEMSYPFKVVFSPNSKSYAYIAPIGVGEYSLIKDGVQGKEKYEMAAFPTYSDNSQNFAFIVKKNGKYIVINNGVEDNKSKYSDIGNVKYTNFASNSKDFYFLSEKNGLYSLYKNGVISKPFDIAYSNGYNAQSGRKYSIFFKGKNDFEILSNNGEQKDGKYSYKIISSFESKNIFPDDFYINVRYLLSKRNNRYINIVDGSEVGEYNKIYDIIYSEESNGFAFVAQKGKKKVVVVRNGIESKEYDAIGNNFNKNSLIKVTLNNLNNDVVYSPDGKNLAFIAKKDRKYVFVNNFVESEAYTNVYNFIFSPDSKRSLFVANPASVRSLLLVDNLFKKEIGNYNMPYITYSPNSKEISFFQYDLLYKNGKEIKPNSKFGKILSYIYSPNSNDFAYVQRSETTGKDFLQLLDGPTSREYSSIKGKGFSPDSKYLYFIAENEGKYFFVQTGDK